MTKFWKKHWLEIVLLSVAIGVAVISIIIYINSFNVKEEEEISVRPSKIFVDIGGSVNKPGLYEASNTTRLKEIIKKAGGLSDNADRYFFSRNFNLSRTVHDEEKIYIPSVWEVNNGLFINNSQPLNNDIKNISDDLININSASIEELDTLPGIGKLTAQKIIDNRPFKALEELINKKIINKSVFENIKNLVKI